MESTGRLQDNACTIRSMELYVQQKLNNEPVKGDRLFFSSSTCCYNPVNYVCELGTAALFKWYKYLLDVGPEKDGLKKKEKKWKKKVCHPS